MNAPSSEQRLDLRLLLLAERPGLQPWLKKELKDIGLRVGAIEREHKFVVELASNALNQIVERAT